ncbi:PREDICTED: uncharacterized protein LOC105563277 [Vollenhovia emeryi]|uniref:uncharacterized protein LOC105563277 n=1 Tax=Vollenhovia emeryi TaxID=411798 RepID=UPI0005F56374|nr:PREDICTED: uncharacterized protein LOC105563277 [Vollenhovia emeryi]
MNYYTANEACKKQCNDFDKPRHTPRILGRRFALTATGYKYLDVGISVSHVQIILADNRGSQLILPHATWAAFIERREAVERFLPSNIASSLSIRELVIERVKMYDENMVKLTLHRNCLYMKPQTLLFLFEIETCVDLVYFELCQNTHSVGEKYKTFVNTIKSNCIIDRRDAIKILHKVSDKTSLIDCELLAFAMDNILYDALP